MGSSPSQPSVPLGTTYCVPDEAAAAQAFSRLVETIAQLRHPETGCPWDVAQTHDSLRPFLLEEAYEAVEAIQGGTTSAIADELGDVLLQVVLHAQLAVEQGTFDIAQVCEGIRDKIIRRHPHVFGDVDGIGSPDAVTRQWEEIKKQEKGQTGKESVLHGVSRGLPALSRAYKVNKKAVKVGFEWPNLDSLWSCVMSEFDELKAEIHSENQDPKRIEEELGDILFAVVNLSRHLGHEPEVALTHATDKFICRFHAMETLIQQRHGSDYPLENLTFEAWDDLWREAKAVSAS